MKAKRGQFYYDPRLEFVFKVIKIEGTSMLIRDLTISSNKDAWMQNNVKNDILLETELERIIYGAYDDDKG